jgi:hypothetical protein
VGQTIGFALMNELGVAYDHVVCEGDHIFLRSNGVDVGSLFVVLMFPS